MAYTDYYDSEEFNDAFTIVNFLDRSGVDPFYNLNQYVQGSSYKLDIKGYLYFILGNYTINLLENTLASDYLENHPYILNYSVNESSKFLNTSLGDVRFSLCVNDIREAYMMSDDKKTIDILCKVYAGKYATKCHEISSLLSIDYEYITTGFINSPLDNYKYLHSFVEDGDYVLDFARNIKMKKADYYELVEPEVLSKINGDRLVSDLIEASHSYPPMTPKDFLVRHDELILKR